MGFGYPVQYKFPLSGYCRVISNSNVLARSCHLYIVCMKSILHSIGNTSATALSSLLCGIGDTSLTFHGSIKRSVTEIGDVQLGVQCCMSARLGSSTVQIHMLGPYTEYSHYFSVNSSISHHKKES